MTSFMDALFTVKYFVPAFMYPLTDTEVYPFLLWYSHITVHNKETSVRGLFN